MRLLVVMTLVLAVCAPAHAISTMRCGSALISVGDSTAEVLIKCGEPFTRDQVGVRYSGVTDKIVELWTYYFGSGQFLKMLTFEAGRLVEIENGDRQ